MVLLDPRCDIEAWKPGISYLIVRDPDSPNAPAYWDGSDDPLTLRRGGTMGLGHFPDESYITSIATSFKPWMNSYTHTGVNCLWEGRIIWFLVDTNVNRDPIKNPFGYRLIEIK